MASQLDKNMIPTTSSKNDAYWRARTEELDIFLLETQTKSPAIQRTTLKETLAHLTQESQTSAFEDRLKYQNLILTVRQELEDLNNTHPESATDKAINLTSTFARTAFDVSKPVVIMGAKIAWAGAVWGGNKLWELSKPHLTLAKQTAHDSIRRELDAVAYMYNEAKPALFATGGMATMAGAGLLVWNLTHTNPDAAPEAREQLAMNDQPETTEQYDNYDPQPVYKHKNTTAKWQEKKLIVQFSNATAAKMYKNANLENITRATNIAAKRGIDPYLAATMALIESQGHANAVSKTGAVGIYQFTEGTGKDYNIVVKDKDYRKNLVKNTYAFINLTKDNTETLSKQLGRPPKHPEIYMAHQQGASAAGNMILNPRKPVTKFTSAHNIAVNNSDPNGSSRDFTKKWTQAYNFAAKSLKIIAVSENSDYSQYDMN